MARASTSLWRGGGVTPGVRSPFHAGPREAAPRHLDDRPRAVGRHDDWPSRRREWWRPSAGGLGERHYSRRSDEVDRRASRRGARVWCVELDGEIGAGAARALKTAIVAGPSDVPLRRSRGDRGTAWSEARGRCQLAGDPE